jgi:2-polyprenyl-3-methyl-5-hydroxy-6-metoxy-1,4-benzoquinol methylase
MTTFDRKSHWEKIYKTKSLQEVSWYQPVPKTSLSFFRELKVSKKAKIIDIGGGDSLLVDHLLAAEFENITVLDISEKAIERAKYRLGDKADKVNWLIGDIAELELTEQYDVWHDRAAFHFLRAKQEILHYTNLCYHKTRQNGFVIIGTFSDTGPVKCSGIEIQQYSKKSLMANFGDKFEKVKCIQVDHNTPFDTTQNFIFCSFKKLSGR